ncbi:MAG: tetratricopeptide repeat protein [Bacteroidaceae bacterium]|nr:tetratricopeptide repeat protein [Bacteroidaceae bacterium]
MTDLSRYSLIRSLMILVFSLFTGTLSAQTVIEMDKGGLVRNKTLRDYDREIQLEETKNDSLKYVDCLTRAFNALHVDSLNEARVYFQEALTLRPQAPGNYLVKKHLAEINEAQGDFKGASVLYSEILKERPEMHQVRVARAAVNVQQRFYQEALADCDYLIKLNHALSAERLYFIRATALMGLRLHREARKDFESVILLNPDNLNAPILLAISLHDDGQHQEALNRLNLHLQNHPENVDALVLRANFFMELKSYDAALRDLTEAIHLAPQRPDIYAERAVCYDHLKNTEAARADRLMVGKLTNTVFE